MSHSATTSASTLSNLNFGNFFSFDQLNNQDFGNKRKRTDTACVHCQKAQLTCDGSRPCQGCIKRDLATTCTDMPHNKRDKQETYEEFAPPTPYPQEETMGGNFLDTNQLLNFSLADLGFGSETAGLEYGIIGNMLQTPLDLISTTTNTSTITSTAPIISHTNNNNNNNNTTTTTNTTNNNNNILTPSMSSTTSISSPAPLTTTPLTTSATTPSSSSSSSKIESLTPMPYNQTSTPFQLSTNGLYSYSSPTTSSANTMLLNQQQQQNLIKRQQQQQQQQHSPSLSSSPTSSSTKLTTTALVNTNGHKRDSVASTTSTNSSRRKGSNGNTPEQVYTSVKRPFNYAEGFHYLIQYVKQRMSREDLMRISRALALIRPSFLSLIMNLTEEDLVFMEKCIQRTLLEYEKLISFSGTPTVVWRRTGEVCLAGKEFSLLTQWTKDALLGKKTYIYELMDDQSAVEYWEHFSTYAFDNTDKACIHSCILRTPQQRPVPCTFCFTIKRDIFDLPSVIIGNFLPILS
ncbi:unnamed protein product [Cunninghamella echinulata]